MDNETTLSNAPAKRKTKSKEKSELTGDATRYISSEATLEIWVRSGGRCARCNKFLLEDEISQRTINLAERAHIVGWIDTIGSPRGKSDLPLDKRNEPSNLVLLCMDCHKVIDDKRTLSEFTVERLHEMKSDHEERIARLTGMPRDRDTAILRVFGMVRGSMPDLARDLALKSVVDTAGRYARFPLAPDRYSLELNMADLADPEDVPGSAYWDIGRARINQLATRISDHVRDKDINHLSVFAFARIPLLVYLGYKLDDTVPTDLYQKQRGGDEGWGWPEDDSEPVQFEIRTLSVGSRPEDTTVIMSLSGTVATAEIPEGLTDTTIYEIRPAVGDPNPNLFRSRSTLDSFSRTYQNLLARLETASPKPDRLHLMGAIPMTLAVTCGRVVMRHVHPEVVVYDRIVNDLKPVLTINER